MKNTLSRRDFLKLTGVGLGALAYKTFKLQHTPLALPQFPAGDRLGRVFGKTDIHSEPNFGAPAVKTLYDDDVVVWQQEVITSGTLDQNIINQRWAKTPDGYIYAPALQPVKNLPNVPITVVPNGQAGFWAETTVPYIDLILEGAPASPHMKFLLDNNLPLRLYYSQTVWIDQIAQKDNVIYYRFNENAASSTRGRGGTYCALLSGEAATIPVLTDDDLVTMPSDPDAATTT